MNRQVQDAYIVAAKRTPIGKAPKGSFRNLRPDDLLVAAIQSALKQVPNLDPKAIEDAIIGCSFPEAEQGINVARAAAQRRRQCDVEAFFQRFHRPTPELHLQVGRGGGSLRRAHLFLGHSHGGRRAGDAYVQIRRRVEQRHCVLPRDICGGGSGFGLANGRMRHVEVGWPRAGLQQGDLGLGRGQIRFDLADLCVEQGAVQLGDEVAGLHGLALGDGQPPDATAERASHGQSRRFDHPRSDESGRRYRSSRRPAAQCVHAGLKRLRKPFERRRPGSVAGDKADCDEG